MIEQANLGGLDVSIEAMIGEGEFGLVYRGTTTFLGTNPRAIVALKCLSKPKAAGNEVCEGNDDNAMRLLFREIDIHRR
jgi:serine/threonine protein kinase